MDCNNWQELEQVVINMKKKSFQIAGEQSSPYSHNYVRMWAGLVEIIVGIGAIAYGFWTVLNIEPSFSPMKITMLLMLGLFLLIFPSVFIMWGLRDIGVIKSSGDD